MEWGKGTQQTEMLKLDEIWVFKLSNSFHVLRTWLVIPSFQLLYVALSVVIMGTASNLKSSR